jgi:hypothetical protein
LRVSAVQSGTDKNRERDNRSPCHLGLCGFPREITGRLKILSRGLIAPKERAMQVSEQRAAGKSRNSLIDTDYIL